MRIPSRGQDQGYDDRDAHKKDEKKHVEKDGANECTQEDQVVSPSEDSMENARNLVHGHMIVRPVEVVSKEAHRRNEYQHNNLETSE